MKSVKVLCLIAIILAGVTYAQGPGSVFQGKLSAGPFQAGFRLLETSDAARSFPSDGAKGEGTRLMRVYVWYPAKPGSGVRLKLDDYAQLARGDFRPAALPVPLAKGFDKAELAARLNTSAGASRDAEAAAGKFPLLLLGQGLFFESPLSHFVLCEFLASHGYVVATSPLCGTRYRLVNLNVEDLETETRDMEFVRAAARTMPFVDAGKLGVIGYDLGGMAGLIVSMRNPEVAGFLSLDSGILDKHFSGLPGSHPQYREARFRIPWMHMTQARFIRPEKERSAAPSLFERKAFGPSYLVHVPTGNHADFSSYAALGITQAVPGYWDAPTSDPKPLYVGICRLSLAFFDACLKGESEELANSISSGQVAGEPVLKIEWKKGQPAPPSEAALVDLIINEGMAKARPTIERIRSSYPGLDVIDESVLNWLGLHFLYWWGREDESIKVFELGTSLHAKSWRAHESLAEACAFLGRTDEAIRSYKRSLEINPDNSGAKAALDRLIAPPKKVPPGKASPPKTKTS